MRTKFRILCARAVPFFLALEACLFFATDASADGSLTPSGPPGATMLSLSQIEPRSPITNTGALTISQPGSYYLTTNIAVAASNAIIILTSNVTLDLNGFTISSTDPSNNATGGTGIALEGGPQNVHIMNGFIRGNVTNSGGTYSGTGFFYGISDDSMQYGGVPANVRITGVCVSGCQGYGIYLPVQYEPVKPTSVIESCTADTIGNGGLFGNTVLNSSAKNCGQIGINATTAINCTGYSIGGTGYYGVYALLAQNCYGYDSTSGGLGLVAGCAENCAGTGSGGGVSVPDGTAINCYGTSSTGAGVNAATAENCWGFSSGTGDGLDADNAVNCSGSSYAGTGLSAYTTQGCCGITAHGPNALYAYQADNCFATNNSGNTGLQAINSVQNSFGSSASGIGLNTPGTALNCYGQSGGASYGLYAGRVAFGCHGSSSSGTGLFATQATSCSGSGTPNYTVANKYQMP